MGGYDTYYANTLNSTEVLDPAASKLRAVPGPAFPEPRGDVGCSGSGSIVYVHGGYYDPSGQPPHLPP